MSGSLGATPLGNGRREGTPPTLLAVVPLAAGVADALAPHAGAVPPALGVQALGCLDVALRPLPAAEALAATPGVLTVTAAENRARRWNREREEREVRTMEEEEEEVKSQLLVNENLWGRLRLCCGGQGWGGPGGGTG